MKNKSKRARFVAALVEARNQLSFKSFIEISRCLLLCLLFSAAANYTLQAQKARESKTERGVKLINNEASRRVDVLINGEPFTSYIWPENIMKPVLYPLRAASGIVVTRGFPLEPKSGERADHPHQVGMWFNFGDVGGVDFWNNSTQRTPTEKARMGTILHQRITSIISGKTKGELAVECVWVMPDGKRILLEKTNFIFHAVNKNLRMIDRITTLTALDREVLFSDNKEGLIALRVARSLEQITNTPDRYIDSNGEVGTNAILNNEGVTGKYLSSEGKTGDDVFGTRGSWAALAGKVEGEKVTLAILDHPKNPNYPAYWFTRGYGLFAANPFGQKAYSVERKEKPPKEPTNFKLNPRESVTFRYRVLILSGVEMIPDEIQKQQQRFVIEVK
jgi:hypothetical protein